MNLVEELSSRIRELWATYGPPKWVTISVAAIYVYYKYASWHYGVFKKLGIKGPQPIPPFGTLLPLFRKGLFEHDAGMRKYGKVVGTFSGRMPCMMIFDEEMLKNVLVKHFTNFPNRFIPPNSVQDYPLKKMMTVLKDDHWRHIRNILSPLFSSGKLRKMQQQIEQCAETLINNLQQKADNNEIFDFREYCGAYTMDVIASTAFGLQIDSHNDPNNQFVRHSKPFFEVNLRSPRILIAVFFPFLLKPLKMLGISLFPKSSVEFFVKTVDKAMDERRSAPSEKERTDFLQLMVNADIPDPDDSAEGATSGGEMSYMKDSSGLWSRKGLTHEEVLAQGILFFLAGYETTANTLSLFAYSLAVNPECQDKLIAEIDGVMKGQDHVTYDVVKQMPYLDMCLCEVQRLYPAGARTNRMAVEDMEINGIFIPKGMCIYIPIRALHMDPDVWPDPWKFNPDRFLPEEKAARNPYYFMPFGVGPRNCIGMRLALLEMKIAMVRLLQKFRFVTCEETQIPIKLHKLVTRAADGVKLRVESRTQQ